MSSGTVSPKWIIVRIAWSMGWKKSCPWALNSVFLHLSHQAGVTCDLVGKSCIPGMTCMVNLDVDYNEETTETICALTKLLAVDYCCNVAICWQRLLSSKGSIRRNCRLQGRIMQWQTDRTDVKNRLFRARIWAPELREMSETPIIGTRYPSIEVLILSTLLEVCQLFFWRQGQAGTQVGDHKEHCCCEPCHDYHLDRRNVVRIVWHNLTCESWLPNCIASRWHTQAKPSQTDISQWINGRGQSQKAIRLFF